MELFKVIEQMKERPLESPRRLWEEFIKSSLWTDMKNDLYCQLHDTWQLMETTRDQDELGELRGRARAIRELIQYPYQIIEAMEDQNGS